MKTPVHGSASARAVSGGLRGIQRRLESFYALEAAPDVIDFVRQAPEGTRETVYVRQAAGGLELSIVLPAFVSWHHAEGLLSVTDECLQAIEGVSHFLYLAERARTELPATQLELELQAEVDKFVLLAFGAASRDVRHARQLHEALYERVTYLHPSDSEAGDRYRLANNLAAKLSSRLLSHGDGIVARRLLRRFYRSGQAEKIRLASAA